jgi:hypothetical protein
VFEGIFVVPKFVVTVCLVAPQMLCNNQAGTGTTACTVGVTANASATLAKTADKSSQAVENSIRLHSV